MICEGWTLTQIDADRGVWRDAFLVLAHQGQSGDRRQYRRHAGFDPRGLPRFGEASPAVAVWAMGGAAAAEAINDEEAGES